MHLRDLELTCHKTLDRLTHTGTGHAAESAAPAKTQHTLVESNSRPKTAALGSALDRQIAALTQETSAQVLLVS
jgi:hypothetical protein